MKRISVPESGIETLYGARDANLKYIESLLRVQIRTHGGDITIEGDPRDELRAQTIVKQLSDLVEEGYPLSNGDVKTAAQLLVDNADLDLRDYFSRAGAKSVTRRRVMPKTVNQRRYLDAIEQCDVVFGVTKALIGEYVKHDSGAPPAPDVKAPWYSLDYTFHVEPGESGLPQPPIK